MNVPDVDLVAVSAQFQADAAALTEIARLTRELDACGRKLLDTWRERDELREALLAARERLVADDSMRDYITRLCGPRETEGS